MKKSYDLFWILGIFGLVLSIIANEKGEFTGAFSTLCASLILIFFSIGPKYNILKTKQGGKQE